MNGTLETNAAVPATVQVRPLVAGECLNLAALTDPGAPWKVRRYPAGFVVLHHPHQGAALFDTGYGLRVLALMRRWPGVLYGLVTPVRLRPPETARAQMAELGLNIRRIILSHLHADHVGGLRDFPGVPISLDPLAYPALRGLKGLKAVRRAFLPELLPPDFEARCEPLRFAPAPAGLSPFVLAADVYADGSVYAVRVPGHAPGMTALIVRSRAGAALDGDGHGLTLLASDAAWSVRALRHNKPVHPLARLAFWNPAQERRSREALHQWLQAHPQAGVIVSHDRPEEDSR